MNGGTNAARTQARYSLYTSQFARNCMGEDLKDGRDKVEGDAKSGVRMSYVEYIQPPPSPRIRLQGSPAQIRQAMLIDVVRAISFVYNHGSTSDGIGTGSVPSELRDRVVFDREISLGHWIRKTIMRTFIAGRSQRPHFPPNARNTDQDLQSITPYLNPNAGHEYRRGARCVWGWMNHLWEFIIRERNKREWKVPRQTNTEGRDERSKDPGTVQPQYELCGGPGENHHAPCPNSYNGPSSWTYVQEESDEYLESPTCEDGNYLFGQHMTVRSLNPGRDDYKVTKGPHAFPPNRVEPLYPVLVKETANAEIVAATNATHDR
ncbi:hypothetical protein V8E52_005250 [Russula decolorans]